MHIHRSYSMSYRPSNLRLPPDEATALSAVRNLKDVAVNGRNLRVESSTDEPGPRRGRGGIEVGVRSGPGGRFREDSPPTPQRAPLPPAREELPPSGRVDIQLLPPGQDLPGQKATDAITKTLAAISPGQMQDVMAGMKTLIATQPDQARQLLAGKPQLAYALFQAMLLMNIVDPSVLQRIQPLPPVAAPASVTPQAYAPPATHNPAYSTYPSSAQSQPPPSSYLSQGQGNYAPYPPPQISAPSFRPPAASNYNAPPQASLPPQGYGGGYSAPQGPPAPPSLPPHAQAQLATLPEDQRAMLLQVLSLSPDQINALDPGQRQSIVQLRQQFLGAAA
ncbi:MAG: hypothetical protein TREMPRED_004782 [Tremellales sp. Tagirdzhanova-0007]|nr:MAG: hypothetical protein TREMPRED_004782 [Tremellales sp. Tagirdzhanova-0007]